MFLNYLTSLTFGGVSTTHVNIEGGNIQYSSDYMHFNITVFADVFSIG